MGQGVCARAALRYLLLGHRKQGEREFRNKGWDRADCCPPDRAPLKTSERVL